MASIKDPLYAGINPKFRRVVRVQCVPGALTAYHIRKECRRIRGVQYYQRAGKFGDGKEFQFTLLVEDRAAKLLGQFLASRGGVVFFEVHWNKSSHWVVETFKGVAS